MMLPMISPARFIRSISLWGAAFAVLAPGFVSAQKHGRVAGEV
jgi:hypothetical protein